MSLDAVAAVLLIPALAAALLALLPGYRLTARLNVLARVADLPGRAVAVLLVAPQPAGPISLSTISTSSSSC